MTTDALLTLAIDLGQSPKDSLESENASRKTRALPGRIRTAVISASCQFPRRVRSISADALETARDILSAVSGG